MALAVVTETFNVADEAAKRSAVINAAMRSGGIVLLGSTIYSSWFIYRFFTNINVQMKEALGEVVAVDWAPVSPWLASIEAPTAMWKLWGGEAEQKADDTDYNLFTPRPIMIKRNNFIKLQQTIDPDTGACKAKAADYAFLKQVEAEAVKAKLIPATAIVKPHIVDRVANFVVDNKMFWGGVLAIASIPPLVLIADATREMVINESKKY